jgi:hypothetical protein
METSQLEILASNLSKTIVHFSNYLFESLPRQEIRIGNSDKIIYLYPISFNDIFEIVLSVYIEMALKYETEQNSKKLKEYLEALEKDSKILSEELLKMLSTEKTIELLKQSVLEKVMKKIEKNENKLNILLQFVNQNDLARSIINSVINDFNPTTVEDIIKIIDDCKEVKFNEEDTYPNGDTRYLSNKDSKKL